MIPLAHVAGIPVEETLGMYGPTLLIGVGVTITMLKARLRRARSGRLPRERR